MKRYGMVIRVRPELEDAYVHLHENTWPGVLQCISDSNIRNYSIFMRDGYLFAYYEYVGEDYEADMAKMAEDPVTQAWWKLTDPCQQPVESAAEGEKWAEMEEVFHHD